MNKLLKLLNLKFDKINLIPTQYKKKVLPNSSFNQRVLSFEKDIKKTDIKYQFPREKLPPKYMQFYKKIKKNFY